MFRRTAKHLDVKSASGNVCNLQKLAQFRDLQSLYPRRKHPRVALEPRNFRRQLETMWASHFN